VSISAQFDRATQLTPVIADHTRTCQQSTPGATYDRSVPIVGGPATRALQVVDGRCLFGSDQDIRFQPVESGRRAAFHHVAQHRLDDLGHPHHVGTDALQSRDRCETAGLGQPSAARPKASQPDPSGSIGGLRSRVRDRVDRLHSHP
jgi:hypothetical protein